MKNHSNISKGQLITVWVFSVIAWYIVIKEACWWYKDCNRFSGSDQDTTLYNWLSFIIPFLLIFYTLGWFKKRKDNELH